MYSHFAHGDNQQVTRHEPLTSEGAKYEKFMSIFGLTPSAVTLVETALSPRGTITRAENAHLWIPSAHHLHPSSTLAHGSFSTPSRWAVNVALAVTSKYISASSNSIQARLSVLPSSGDRRIYYISIG